MPDSILQRLFSDRSKVLEYISVWADSFDYGYGLDDILKINSQCDFAQELLKSGDQQLRATVTLLLE